MITTWQGMATDGTISYAAWPNNLSAMTPDEHATWHETRRDMHMELARGYRTELDGLRVTNPDEYALMDRDATIGEQVYLARWHNRAAWIIRWHERTTPKQASLFGGAV